MLVWTGVRLFRHSTSRSDKGHFMVKATLHSTEDLNIVHWYVYTVQFQFNTFPIHVSVGYHGY